MTPGLGRLLLNSVPVPSAFAAQCSCCHRVYHQDCYDRHVSRTERISLPDPHQWDEGQPWFHSQACRQVGEHRFWRLPVSVAAHTATGLDCRARRNVQVHENLRRQAALGERHIALASTSSPSTTAGQAGQTRAGQGRGMFGWLGFGAGNSSGSTPQEQGQGGAEVAAAGHQSQSSLSLAAAFRGSALGRGGGVGTGAGGGMQGEEEEEASWRLLLTGQGGALSPATRVAMGQVREAARAVDAVLVRRRRRVAWNVNGARSFCRCTACCRATLATPWATMREWGAGTARLSEARLPTLRCQDILGAAGRPGPHMNVDALDMR